jgi:UDP-2,3-diacylglucosamine pyrophosphatase LpxH
VRTLVISDLHLGARLRHGVLSRPEPLRRLLEAISEVDRLVLLGDVVELLEGRPQQAMAAAEPVLRAIGAAVGSDREVVLVPGNHDLALVRSWVRPRSASLTVDTAIAPDATPLLRRLVSWLSPAPVQVRYPGAWLGDGIWATHGHYLDRHLLPDKAFGIARGLLGRPPRDNVTPGDYELAGGPSVTRIEALLTSALPRPLAALVEDVAELLRASTMPLAPTRLLHPRLARLNSAALGVQMRRASIPALARVVHRLQVQADWVVFGHVHRLGPLPGDRASQWQATGGRPRILNTGSWTYEPLLVRHATPSHPYWPGGAVLLVDGVAPRAMGLLEGLSADAVR